MSNRIALVWAAIVLEMVSPIPAVLSIGAIWVLLARPRWFYDLVREHYHEEAGPRDR